MLYIYTGPSLDHDSTKKLAPSNSIVCPPIKGGDVLNLLSDELLPPPTHIHIIDGYYYNVPSVRHKEILQALEQGITVSGCSSMGAIRAAECSDFGMIGTGRIFNYFASQLVTGDDEIAVSHHAGPSFEKISTPLINIRFTIEDLCDEGLIASEIAEQIISYFAEMHFSDRYLRLLENHQEFGQYYQLLHNRYKDWKAIDAMESLKLLPSMDKPELREKSHFFSGYNPVNFYNDTNVRLGSVSIERNQLPNALSAVTNYQKTLYDSFNRSLTVKFAKHLGFANTQDELAAFKTFVDSLKENQIKYNHLPLNYLNYSDVIIDQELLILKLHLWLADSAGLNGNLSVLSDYFCCFNINIDTDQVRPSFEQKEIFYNSLYLLCSTLNKMPEEILHKYLGLSQQEFCHDDMGSPL